MRCPHQHAMLGTSRHAIHCDDEQVEKNMREAWEPRWHADSKDEMNIVLQGLEQHFWRGMEAGWRERVVYWYSMQ